MRALRLFLPGVLLVASAIHSSAQTAPVPAATPGAVPLLPTAGPAPTNAASDKLLLKVGLNAGRAITMGGYDGFLGRVPLSVGAEVALSSKFTLYGQADADFSLRRRTFYGGERSNLIPAGAVGLGGRYYYNQAGRARSNRAHGQFIGNYVGLEAHAEMRRLYGRSVQTMPSLNLLWGMQRRINRSLLFDINAGVGAGASYNRAVLGLSSAPLTLTTQLNASLYFGR
ncbi:hypothetical protein BEN48_01765 [Hymenobacter glacialis]|uniref:Outer membrane protein beta-barrel domain-containing protein n=2 Tax=Hymenobacter glacialis TaxID=1908236 RepID=A0A1G1T3Y7_9BACT|nr:hypothetical protein BEN48_01765 [Hymenobacter glacialis]